MEVRVFSASVGNEERPLEALRYCMYNLVPWGPSVWGSIAMLTSTCPGVTFRVLSQQVPG